MKTSPTRTPAHEASTSALKVRQEKRGAEGRWPSVGLVIIIRGSTIGYGFFQPIGRQPGGTDLKSLACLTPVLFDQIAMGRDSQCNLSPRDSICLQGWRPADSSARVCSRRSRGPGSTALGKYNYQRKAETEIGIVPATEVDKFGS
jgi:hypothetical protein